MAPDRQALELHVVLLFMFQFTIEARDSRLYFTKTATATMTINVQRNRPPRFLNLPQDITISENLRNNSVIFTVSATDDDLLRDVSIILIYNVLFQNLFLALYMPFFFFFSICFIR